MSGHCHQVEASRRQKASSGQPQPKRTKVAQKENANLQAGEFVHDRILKPFIDELQLDADLMVFWDLVLQT